MNAMTMQRGFEDAIAGAPVLSALECKVVGIALHEANDVGRVPADGAFSRLWHAITGIEPRRPLADPRLETLRRFVAAVRRGEAGALARRLLDMGFTRRQLEAVTLLARRR